jgi:hypothetical protein
MSTPLRVVTHRQPSEAPRVSDLSERIRQLQAEAKGLAREHVEALAASLLETQRIADEIADGGDAYPPGLRDLARRLSENSSAGALTIRAIAGRF